MSFPVKPIYLLADSQLLFWQPEEGPSFLERVRGELGTDEPKAAYVGASNGDQPEYFDLFVGAMETVGIRACRMIPSEPEAADLGFFDQADLVLLAGGDVHRGWRTFKKNGLDKKLIERYYDGLLLIGLSAGAIQLGLYGFTVDDAGELRLFETWKLVPAIVDAHQEPDWTRLARAMEKAEDAHQGLGIPSGGGAVLHQDLTLEPVRRSLQEFSRGEEGEVSSSLVFPPRAAETADGEAADDP